MKEADASRLLAPRLISQTRLRGAFSSRVAVGKLLSRHRVGTGHPDGRATRPANAVRFGELDMAVARRLLLHLWRRFAQ